MLLLVPIWPMILAPYILRHFASSELEKIDSTTTMEGRGVGYAFGMPPPASVPILIEAHAYTVNVKGDNVTMKVESKMMNNTDPDNPIILEDHSGNSTYVFNKFTGKNVPNAPEADKNRTGYQTLYPSHLKAGEDIPDVWSDSSEKTITLKFKGIVVEEGVKLYKYFANETITKMMDLGSMGQRNCTLTTTKTTLIEPLFGAPAYTENETFSMIALNPSTGKFEMPFIQLLTYKDTEATKTEGLAYAKMAYDGIQLLELYIPTIFGVIAIILTIGLALKVRRLKRKAT